MGFFKNLFGKKTCALCAKECGVMSRTKIKNGDYLCSDCGDLCSRYIRLSELTLDEIKGHIEYMKRQNRLFEEVYSKTGNKETIPLTIKVAGIEFCDDLGMFRIKYKNFTGRGKMNELFRYDQVASYEEYYDEAPSSEPGKNPEFKGGGLKIKLFGGNMSNVNTENNKGLRTHPYIKQEIKVCFSNNNKKDALAAHSAKCKFDYIFGISDNSKGLFDFGLSKEEKRQLQGAVGMANVFGTAIKAAAKGEAALTEEEQEKLKSDMNAAQDAATGGMAVYSRRADEAQAKLS